jgi:hypothetical protein
MCKCPVGTTLCGPTCVNLTGSDADNCGACGHGCLGGTCSGGLCQPITLAPGGAGAPGTVAEVVNGLTTDGFTVFWTYDRGNVGSGGDGVLSCATTGCAMNPTALFTGTGNFFGDLTIAAGSLYWLAGGRVSFIDTLPVSGGMPKAIGTFPVTGGIASDGRYVYWGGPDTVTGTPSILICDPTACTDSTYVTATTANIVIGSAVYWTDSSLNKVRSCPAGTSCTTPTDLSPADANAGGLATDGTNVYWFDAGGLKECSVTGCSNPVILSSGQAGMGNGPAANDGAYVYWTNGAVIMRANVGVAGSGTEIATGQLGAANIAVDATGVYWSVDTGAIMKVAK